MMERSRFSDVVCRELGLDVPEPDLAEWTQMVQKIRQARSHTAELALVGKDFADTAEWLGLLVFLTTLTLFSKTVLGKGKEEISEDSSSDSDSVRA